MTRNVILFGNGLGRSLDNDFFSLERVLQSSWENEDILDDAQRALICACLEGGVVEDDLVAPTKEEELSDLQRVLDACDTIKEFEAEDAGQRWLTERGGSFPVAIRRYFHHAASLFHRGEFFLPQEFAEPLRQFVCANGPDIVTLNYDDLLYEAFTGTPVFKKHFLRDGFFKGDLNFTQQEKWFDPKTEGWFLHLHGSPLFVTRDGMPRKLTRDRLAEYMGENSFHIVLTNADSKPSVIENSQILSQYWAKLDELLRDAENITLFGYGGGDMHLNRLIGLNNKAQLRIVSRIHTDDAEELEVRWRKKLRAREAQVVEIVMIENLMQFTDW
ncbi:SIR2 family protein [Sulfitobacter sp. MF3-043]|uniref:SIR2 family protein n=1 Tax=Sulfitobacter sediminivivens TaxID=3252902 RepID=UPI0036DCE8C5